MNTLQLARFALRHRAEIMNLPRPNRLASACFVPFVLVWTVLSPVLLLVQLVRRPSREMTLWNRLRFHWGRPLTSPAWWGGLYHWVDFVQRRDRGEIDFVESKLTYHELFRRCGVRTPRLFLTIDPETPRSAADRLPPKDLVIKPNFGGGGRGVQIHRHDATSGLYDGQWSAAQLLERYRAVRRPPGQSFLATEFVPPSPQLPDRDHAQHLRIVTLRTGAEPRLFLAMRAVQFDRSRPASNHAQHGTFFDVTCGDHEGVPLPHFAAAVENCLRLHRELDVVSVGWDVILAADGPCFLEGNIAHGPCHPDFEFFYAVVMDYYRETGFLPVPESAPRRALALTPA